MPQVKDASPLISVRLYKTISRKTIDGQAAVSARYQGKDEYIDLTPFLNAGSAVRTSKSVRDPAGSFSITFADMPQTDGVLPLKILNTATSLESIYGLVEPMDMIEIRMWNGVGAKPQALPIIMRGFVSEVQRMQSMGNNGIPNRQVVVSGQDYGKIWQTFQVIYLAAYGNGKALLTNFALNELFGVGVVAAMQASEFVREMIAKIINPHIKGLMPENSPLPKELKTGDSISVKHGKVNNSFHNQQGSIYDILKFHGDVGIWNELYTEDREDGVHVVYRPIPALNLNKPGGPVKDRKIQDDAPDPIYCEIPDGDIQSLSVARTDSNVANFYWVNNSRFDMIDDLQRKLAAIPKDDSTVSLHEYPNTAVKYYGVRPMYGETQQADDKIEYMGSGLDKDGQEKRASYMEEWITRRRRLMMEMNKDNVVLERGSARIKGGPMRPDGKEAMKAGDYARIKMGRVTSDAYVIQIDHEFLPFQSYITTLSFERGEGFAVRASMEGGVSSPWLAEQARRNGVIL